ncbi:DUF5312 family protein [Candidatus Haliotispira prima]|uniref:DUF5312 family protein n=1 Tax=Candidatus Haliotispira prima TaxID=3034016 RepID=A0ABY8ML68_9SPIO|nr:DUF5312 family protein [Candidatus Haliotispira prima]
MADNPAQNIDLPEREELYTKFTEAVSSEGAEKQEQTGLRSKRLADGETGEPAADSATEDPEFIAEELAEANGEAAGVEEHSEKDTTLVSDFHKLTLVQRLWYYFLSLFTRKPVEVLFQQAQLYEVRQEIIRRNNELITYDHENKIYLVSSYLPERFNAVFKLSLEILPIINQVDRNLKFMQDIMAKLVFSGYKSNSGKSIRTDAENFISQKDFRRSIFMGDAVTRDKISNLMEDVSKRSEDLPLSLHKYSVQILKALYQFQKICYFPFSNFFHTFRTEMNHGNSIYSNILPQDAYESVNILYQLTQEIGPIEIDKSQFREIISSYFSIVRRRDTSSTLKKTAVHFLESFVDLQTTWNTFIKRIPLDYLLLFTAENPYLDISPVREISNEVLGNLPRQLEKVYQESVRENIEKLANELRESRTKYYFGKYLSNSQFGKSNYYNNNRSDLIPQKNGRDDGSGLFAHCEAFAYTQNFLRYFCAENIFKPLHVLSKGVFKSDNFVYNKIVEFLVGLENHKIKLDIIEQGLRPEHRVDTEIKEILMRIEHRSEGARDEYGTTIMNIDREIRFLIEQVINDLRDFGLNGLPAIENAIQDELYERKFGSFIPQFQYMKDYNNLNYAPLTPSGILELWSQYLSEFTLLLRDQLELECQSILGRMSSKIVTVRSRRR